MDMTRFAQFLMINFQFPMNFQCINNPNECAICILFGILEFGTFIEN